MIKASMTYERLYSLSADAAEKIRRILKVIWKALSFSAADESIAAKHSLCIAIEKDYVSIASGSRLFSRYRIENCKRQLLEEGLYRKPEKVASLIASLLAEYKAGKKEVILCIPGEWAIFRTVDFPLTVKENLPDVVSYELDRLTPLSPENAYYDYQVTGEHEGRINVALTVANADFINKYLDALKDKDVVVDVVSTDISASNALITRIKTGVNPIHHYELPQEASQSSIFSGIKKMFRSLQCKTIALRYRLRSKKAGFILLNVSDKAYKGILSINGMVVSSFSEVMETPNIKALEDAVIAEINKSITALGISGKGMQSVVSFKDISLSLEQRISVPVRVLRDADLKVNFKNKTGDVPYIAAGGVMESLSAKAKGTNLLSRGRHEKKKTPLIVSAFLVLTLFIIGIANLIIPLQMDENKLHEIERQIAGLKEEVNKAEALKKERDRIADEISTISDFKEEGPMTLAIIKDITNILPKSSWLTRLRITDKTVDMEGYATSSPADLLAKLEASEYLKKVEFASPTVRDTRMNSDRFIFKMEIEDAEDIEEPKQKTDETQKK